eukprot:Polyplicarium_translucidae@DN3251_c0_g1_i1.p1
MADRRAVGGTAHAIANAGKIGRAERFSAEMRERRLAMFKQAYEAQQEKEQALSGEKISIRLPDGNQVEGEKRKTTPLDVARGISTGLANAVVVAKVKYLETVECESLAAADDDEVDEDTPDLENENEDLEYYDFSELLGETERGSWILWDAGRPLEGSCALTLLKFDDEEARNVFWHSGAHVLGQCLENVFESYLTVGPATTNGFYYDSDFVSDTFKQDYYPKVEQEAARIAAAAQPFQRLVLSKQEALRMFADNPFKVELVQKKIPDGGMTTCYRCGDLIDLCMGPHVSDTSKIKAFSVTKHSAAYWLGKAGNDSLQRVYGVAFPDSKSLKEYKKNEEEMKKRDHRFLGQNMNFFFFDSQMSPGAAFWLPDGAYIYNKLCDFMRSEYRVRGFQEVVTPNMFCDELFRVSGHLQNFKKDMFLFPVEGKDWGLKPMNCPSHCIIFRHMNLSYKQLPIRMADFGVLHRNEASGSLSGLTRVRRFQQDDAHIFCRLDQVQEEVAQALDFLRYIYSTFGFDCCFMLATRPKKALGSKALWRQAERALAQALKDNGLPWKLNPGDGAFYGPKIDIRLQDGLKRWHQCGTIQVDFNLPMRFDLQYRTDEVYVKGVEEPTSSKATAEASPCQVTVVPPGKEVSPSWETPLKPGYARPVMVHRAILGSIERLTAVLVEHTGGRLPFWLSPRQAIVCPISEKQHAYARHVHRALILRGFQVRTDASANTINKRIRDAQVEQWNFMLVVGAKEEATNTVTLRRREDPQDQRVVSMRALLEELDAMQMPCSATRPTQYEDFVTTAEA